MKAQELLRKGCTRYLRSVKSKPAVEPNIQNIHVVYKFPDVFPEDLLGFPPKRKIDFEIQLIPEATSISEAPYRMTLVELIELKVQLE